MTADEITPIDSPHPMMRELLGIKRVVTVTAEKVHVLERSRHIPVAIAAVAMALAMFALHKAQVAEAQADPAIMRVR